jgi:hypothetical protein
VIRRLVSFVVLAAALASVTPAAAALLISVDKTNQRMVVSRDDEPLYVWPVSTGVRGHDTPSGVYQPFRMEKDHYSREWDDAPMPNSIFFTTEGHAIHGSSHVKRLGNPASHGCVRLAPQNAATLWKLVREAKMANVRVVLTGEIPGGPGEKVPSRGVDPYGDEAYYGRPFRRAGATGSNADRYFLSGDSRGWSGGPRGGFTGIFGR